MKSVSESPSSSAAAISSSTTVKATPAGPSATQREALAELRLLKPGASGAETRKQIETLQQKLATEGLLTPDSFRAGDFDPATRAAVIAYQQRNQLKVDGVVGQQTWGALLGMTGVEPGATLLKEAGAPEKSWKARPAVTGTAAAVGATPAAVEASPTSSTTAGVTAGPVLPEGHVASRHDRADAQAASASPEVKAIAESVRSELESVAPGLGLVAGGGTLMAAGASDLVGRAFTRASVHLRELGELRSVISDHAAKGLSQGLSHLQAKMGDVGAEGVKLASGSATMGEKAAKIATNVNRGEAVQNLRDVGARSLEGAKAAASRHSPQLRQLVSNVIKGEGGRWSSLQKLGAVGKSLIHDVSGPVIAGARQASPVVSALTRSGAGQAAQVVAKAGEKAGQAIGVGAQKLAPVLNTAAKSDTVAKGAGVAATVVTHLTGVGKVTALATVAGYASKALGWLGKAAAVGGRVLGPVASVVSAGFVVADKDASGWKKGVAVTGAVLSVAAAGLAACAAVITAPAWLPAVLIGGSVAAGVATMVMK